MKSVSVLQFNKTGSYVIHPFQGVKDNASFAIPPYIKMSNVSLGDLVDKILETLEYSKSSLYPPDGTPQSRMKEYLKGVGVKSMKELHQDSIYLDVFCDNDVLEFIPSQNLGSKGGFGGYKENLDVKVSSEAPKEELVKALELALSRCK